MKARLASVPVRVGLAVAGNLVALALGFLLLVSPQRDEAARAAREANAAQAQVEQARAAAAVRGSAATQQPIRTADLYRLAKAMPSSADMPDLLLELDQEARAAGVSVVSIAPGAETPGEGYRVVPIQLGFTGDFFSLTDLLYRLRRLVTVRHGALEVSGRLLSVGSVQITPAGRGRKLNATVTVDAYVYGGSGAGAAAGASGTATGADTTATTTTSGGM
ncbi:MAG: type 4a pilus biogenesis protein PilO [Thermoleophilia bacterium]|nr:type 4a pilus biogenesis protein PilO [Thermoleophilia bacterium]